MSYKEFLSIGFIPNNHPGGLVVCGDPDASATIEVNFHIENEVISCLENTEFKLDGSAADWFSPTSPVWESVAEQTNKIIAAPKLLDCQTIGSIWAYIMDEPFNDSEVCEIESDFGEFHNDSKKLNGLFYFRYQQFEDDEVTQERILIP